LEVPVSMGMSPVSVSLHRVVLTTPRTKTGGRGGFSPVYAVVAVVAVVVVALILLRERILKALRGLKLPKVKRGKKTKKPKGSGGLRGRGARSSAVGLMVCFLVLLSIALIPVSYAGSGWVVKVVDVSGVSLSGNYTVVYPDGRVVMGVFDGSFTVWSNVSYCWVTVSVPGYEEVTRLVSGSVTIVLRRLESLVSLETLIGNVSTNRGMVGEKVTVLVRVYGVSPVSVMYLVYGAEGKAEKVGANTWRFAFVLPNASVVPVTVRVLLKDGTNITKSTMVYVIRKAVEKERVVVGVPEAINQTFKVLALVERDLASLRGNLSAVQGAVGAVKVLESRVAGLESAVGNLSKLVGRVSGLESKLKSVSSELKSVSGEVALLKNEVSQVKKQMGDVQQSVGSMRVMALVGVVFGLLGMVFALSAIATLKRMRGEVK